MKFKVGEKVSFLNEKRNGVISKIIGNKMVMVAIEDGFEIPVIETDLVSLQYSEFPIEQQEPEQIESESFPDRFDLVNPSKSRLKQGLYLSFLPDDEKNSGGGKTHIYLVNHTIFDALFSYSLAENGEYICCDFDRIDTETAIRLSTIESSHYEQWKAFSIQAILFIKNSSQQMNPISAEIKINPVKLYKEDTFIFTDIFDYPAYCVPIKKEKNPEPAEWKEQEWTNEKIEKKNGLKIIGHINDLGKKAEFPEEYIIDKDIAEIDLHIEELMEDFSGKSNHELLNFQMDFFVKMLEQAIASKMKKIVFIHGVGNGSLKNSLIEKLKNDYPFLKFQDATYAKYGKGATEVIF